MITNPFLISERSAKMITKWLLELSEYSYTFHHLQEKLGILANYLYRTPLQNNSSTLDSDPNEDGSNKKCNYHNEYINGNTIVSSVDPPIDIFLETIKTSQD